MLTFAGEGYTPAFVANFERVVARIAAGEPVEVVEGPDDVCAPLRGTTDTHCLAATVRVRDAEALRVLDFAGPAALDRTAIAALRERFAAGTIRSACAGCSWFDLCGRIAASGFAAARL
jgi:hypothetical protein